MIDPRILHVVGARPNFMKAAPLIAALGDASGVRQALADVSGFPVEQVQPTVKLKELFPKWNKGVQSAVVSRTNELNVFDPFDSSMRSPAALIPDSRTVQEWEEVVWTHQDPDTPCRNRA